jgi:hypothetical protein
VLWPATTVTTSARTVPKENTSDERPLGLLGFMHSGAQCAKIIAPGFAPAVVLMLLSKGCAAPKIRQKDSIIPDYEIG